MTSPETRLQRRLNGSLVAGASLRILVLAVGLVAGACSSSDLPAASTPTPTATAQASPSPSPSPSGDEVPVDKQVLPPATDPPVAQLCRTAITTTADQNATPLFCHDGAVNVLAWSFYGAVSDSILSLGLNPNNGQPQSAMCDDIAHNGAKRSQEVSAYRLAAAYYGWTFTFDPTKVTCP